MLIYIKHIIWRFAKRKPEAYRLLDVRHNVMKNLILGDCSHLIKFILFGDFGDKKNKKKEKDIVIRHIPRSISWPGKKFIRDDDIQFDDNDNEKIMPENDMELAIYRYKGKLLYNV